MSWNYMYEFSPSNLLHVITGTVLATSSHRLLELPDTTTLVKKVQGNVSDPEAVLGVILQ